MKNSEIAQYLNSKMLGKDIDIFKVSTLKNIHENSLIFSKKKVDESFFKNIENVCLIVTDFKGEIYNNSVIISENPRLAIAKTIKKFFAKTLLPGISKNSIIHPSAKIGKDVYIGEFCVIGENVEISEGTQIMNNVVIKDNVKIGKNCLIKSNTVIGEKGFGFEFEKDGTPVEFPHIGSVIIEDNVEIGALNTIAAGTIENTIIHSYVKTNDQVHIAHNCEIGEKTIITACSEISGSVSIGKRCWIGPNCSIINNIKIEDDSLVGLGSVVIKDIPPNCIVVGNPAKFLKNRF